MTSLSIDSITQSASPCCIPSPYTVEGVGVGGGSDEGGYEGCCCSC